MSAGRAEIARTRAGFRRRMAAIDATLTARADELSALMHEWVGLAREDTMWGIIEVIFDSFSRLVERTPVDTGRARNTWQITGAPTEYVPTEEAFPNRNDVAAIVAAFDSDRAALAEEDIIYITNNLDYIMALEAGWSKNQAGGFIGLFLQDLKRGFVDLSGGA